MARKGVAILREIAMVKASGVQPDILVKMLKELNDELAELYKPVDVKQQSLNLGEVSKAAEKAAK